MNTRRLKKAFYRLQNLPKGRYFFAYLLNKAKGSYFQITKSTQVAYPSNLMLELTNLCNLACTTCPRETKFGSEMSVGKMKLSEAKKLIDEVWPYLDSLGLTGLGETFFYQDLVEIAHYVKSKNRGIVLSASTNANFPGALKSISKAIGVIDTLQVSMDGIGTTYEEIRLKGSFSSFKENLQEIAKLCLGSSTTLMVNLVVTRENYRQMPEVVAFVDSLGIPYLDFTLYNLASVDKPNFEIYQFFESKEFARVVAELEKVEASAKVQVNRNFKPQKGFKHCPYPFSHFYIQWEGYQTPCCAKPFPKELNFGNVFSEGLLNTLNSKEFREFRQASYANKTPDFCKSCHAVV